jgi:predicted glycosyltransferase
MHATMTGRRTVWIDVTNSPHVLFFRPILRRLADAGVPVVVTARDFAQTLGLLELYAIPHTVIGGHGGAGVVRKGTVLARRTVQLLRFGRSRSDIGQAVSHGSFYQTIAAKGLRIHSTVIHDFEGATGMHRINFRLADKVMVPEVIPWETLARLGLTRARYRPYPGIKEQVTLADFEPDPTVLDQLGLDPARPIAVLRPPATMSLYHRGIENTLFDDVLTHLREAQAQVVLLPRTPDQARSFERMDGVLIPPRPVDGPSLVYAADLVVSAGGTMNREAALLGTPTWTTFAGELGAVDRMLVETGRMGVLERPDQIRLTKRAPGYPPHEALADAVTREILAR